MGFEVVLGGGGNSCNGTGVGDGRGCGAVALYRSGGLGFSGLGFRLLFLESPEQRI